MFGVKIGLVAVVLATVYFYVKYLYSYWQRRGIPYLKPSFPFGNFNKFFIQKWPTCVQLTELYRSTSEPFIGIFMLHKPLLFIRDTKLIRDILIKDFQYFIDRDFYLNEKDEPITGHLGALRGQRWRDRRTKLTLVFTPNKLKMIFGTILDCSNQLQAHLSKVVNANQAIDMEEIILCYTINVMASVAFGVDIDCLRDPNHPLRIAERQTFGINFKNTLRFFGWFLQHNLLKWSGLGFLDRSVEKYFLKLVANTLEMREQRNIVRQDLFQLLVQLRNNASSTTLGNGDDGYKSVTGKSTQKSLTFEEVAAEASSSFLAGIGSISLTISCCLYEIAQNSDIQQKIHAEIDQAMAQHNGQLTYEAINELKYLDCCINESLRKYQPLDLSRVCVKDYKIPETNVTIEKGTTIVISTFALHHDEQFYPDSKKFDPTRFSSENKVDKNITNLPFLPFGDGPRACLGQRMAKMASKIGVCTILRLYHVDVDDQHIGKELKFTVNFHPIGGIHLKLKAKSSLEIENSV